MKAYILNLAMLMIGLVAITGCDTAQEAASLANMARCEYQVGQVSSITVGGVDMTGKTSISQLSLTDYFNLSQAFLTNRLPLTMKVNLNVKNPTDEPAAIQTMKYNVLLESKQITTGALAQPFNVAALGNGTLSLPVSTDLIALYQGQSLDAILNLVLSLVGQSDKPTKVGMQVKPSFTVLGQVLEFPDYIDVNAGKC
jgi:hypothetical protein